MPYFTGRIGESVIHHRSHGLVNSSRPASVALRNNMVVMHRIKQRKHTPLWLILSLVVVMGMATLFSSVQLEESWLSLSQSIADQFDALPNTSAGKAVDTSKEAQEQWRTERNRIFRHYPPDPRETPAPSEVCGNAPDYSKWFEQLPNRRSLNDEDKTLYSLFSSAFRGVGDSGRYVEIGAYNGRAESNTRFFHECLGWTGLLIEANPIIYNALVRNRPYDHRMSFSPTCTLAEEMSSKTVPFHSVDKTTAGIEGSALRHMGQEHVNVPCGSLTPLLKELFPEGHIDLFSLDVENAEADVVEKLDFSQLFIEIIIVENNSAICAQECEIRDRVRKKLKEAGYKIYPNVVTESDLFIHPHSKYQLPKDYPKIPVEGYIAQG
jgi:hypothetical protein